jgi:hypothetical protein
MKRRPKFRTFARANCENCGGSGWRPQEGNSAIMGKRMQGVVRCECVTTIDLRKPKKAKVTYDGKAQAFTE